TCARTGTLSGVKALLAAGANVNAKESTHDQTALMWAVAEKQADLVPILVAAGADVRARSKVMPRLAWTGTREITADQGDMSPMVMYSYGGFTSLLFAAQQGDIPSARALLAAGADINERAANGSSALAIAAQGGQRLLATLLIEHGA